MILLVEDTESIRKLVKLFLKDENIEIHEAQDGIEALKYLENGNKYELLLVDIMMPNLNGLELTKEIRNFSEVPIIFLTALSDEKSQIMAYSAGADGYLTKPFSKDLLKSVIKRYLNKKKDKKQFEGLEILEDSRKILIDGEEISLAAKERELLFYLIENIAIAKSREQILNGVWGYDYFGNDRVVDNHIKKLRIKLGKYSKFIKTVKLIGYMFEE
ncbi:DNA-binding response regulator, OmpR family, contains REC and winged-helix (wHTH) domain [Cetobacterium ceti]|uniref:DNA-binding response regulator, OmpR family, contains REC and winged-helix (WHTH) domain n=1 Tax=Cetobacterium ceti TaxID=180163 RepID=A0A1T4PEE4_9FUSO|nr:response regulator transcription factor [Cetobacterium ceti]SJZ89849.1 DNA-binding response regulator, OmpR family, contains REC and winged-helix (wHTH) domain [Cetobacterium ceti]